MFKARESLRKKMAHGLAENFLPLLLSIEGKSPEKGKKDFVFLQYAASLC